MKKLRYFVWGGFFPTLFCNFFPSSYFSTVDLMYTYVIVFASCLLHSSARTSRISTSTNEAPAPGSYAEYVLFTRCFATQSKS